MLTLFYLDRRKWSHMAETCLGLCKAFEKRLWSHQHALRQFEHILSPELLMKLEERNLWVEQLQDMTAADIGASLRHPAVGEPHLDTRVLSAGHAVDAGLVACGWISCRT